VFGVVGVVSGHRDMLGSGGGLWDMPASHLGLWNIVGVVSGRQDMC
jgi:hypothetical protein